MGVSQVIETYEEMYSFSSSRRSITFSSAVKIVALLGIVPCQHSLPSAVTPGEGVPNAF